DIIDLHTEESHLEASKVHLLRFLEDDLGFGPDQMKGTPLEDVYTPIDRCIADGTSLKSSLLGRTCGRPWRRTGAACLNMQVARSDGGFSTLVPSSSGPFAYIILKLDLT